MRPRPPRSPLFPYTRSSDLGRARHTDVRPQRAHNAGAHRSGLWLASTATTPMMKAPSNSHQTRWVGAGACWASTLAPIAPRSEEHTSELQSRVDLVCRLLLE